MVGYTINNRNRYKCNFCNHTTYKHHSGVSGHLESQHKHELDLAIKDAEIERLKNSVQVQEKIVYRDPPTKTKTYWYPVGIYCSTCHQAIRNAGIPEAQSIESTPHSNCGNKTLMLITEFA